MGGLPRKLTPRRPNNFNSTGRGADTRNLDSRGRPIQRDDSWRDKTDRRVKGWDRGKGKKREYVKKTYKETLVWEEHINILQKAGIRVNDLKPWEMHR